MLCAIRPGLRRDLHHSGGFAEQRPNEVQPANLGCRAVNLDGDYRAAAERLGCSRCFDRATNTHAELCSPADVIGGQDINRCGNLDDSDGLCPLVLAHPARTRHQRVLRGSAPDRQQRQEELLDVDDVALGHQSKMRWNDRTDWIWSENPTHEALVDLEQFTAAQAVFTGAQRASVRRERTKHTYLLSGHVHCAECRRRMQGSWNHKRAYYRCKFPAEYAVATDKHPKTIYVRKDALAPAIDGWLAQLFDDDIDDTCAALETGFGPDPAEQTRITAARKKLAECDSKLAKYRQALEAGTDPTIVGEWIAEVKLARKAAEISLRPKTADGRLTSAEIKDLVSQLKGIVAILDNADPIDRKAVYNELDLSIVYHDDGRMQVSAGPDACTNKCVGGGT